MSYTKNIWATGDTITAAKLNNMENGIAESPVLVVRASAAWDFNLETFPDNTTLDKTWQEIVDAVGAGKPVVLLAGAEDTEDITNTICSCLPLAHAFYYGAYIAAFTSEWGGYFCTIGFRASTTTGTMTKD